MKISLSLLVSTIAVCATTLAACDGGGPGPLPTGGTTGGGGIVGTGGVATGGVVGTGGGTGGTGAVGTGGTGAVGTGGSTGGSLGNLLFDGSGTWVDAGMNTVEIQGAFFILEDSIKNNEPVDDGLTHSDVIPDSGGSGTGALEFSKFDDLTTKPCISGTVIQVTDETGAVDCSASDPEDMAGACQWSAQWGAGIGLNLNETGGEDSMKSTWDALAHNVAGFKFTASGMAPGATLRVKIKNAGSDEDFCSEFQIVPGTEVEVAWADFEHMCWGSAGTMTPVLTAIESLQWQIVSSADEGYAVTNFCIETVSWF
jgi:hypothetical protein